MASPILQFFKYSHLPTHLQAVSAAVYELAWLMEKDLPDGPEKSAGLRKLLEAKDCFVRSALVSEDPVTDDGCVPVSQPKPQVIALPVGAMGTGAVS